MKARILFLIYPVLTLLMFCSCASRINLKTCENHKSYLKENQKGPYDIKSKYCISRKKNGDSGTCEVKLNIYNRLNGELVSEGFVSIDSTDYPFSKGKFAIRISSDNHRIGISSFDEIANFFIIENLNLENTDYIEINCYIGGIIQI